KRVRIAAVYLAIFPVLAADRIATSYESIRPVLEEMSGQLPAELQAAKPAERARAWTAWSGAADTAIRARLEQGDVDSMVNLLLFGTSFTKQPRMTMENLGAETRAGLLRARLDDLMAGLASPGTDERMLLLGKLLQSKELPPKGAATGAFILANLQRVLKERVAFAARIETAKARNGASDTYAEHASLFSDRGVSLDTTILPNFAIDAALRELKSRGLLKSKQVARAAVIGPGLDFIDKEAGFDYYPQQTLQPFAILDSLQRVGLAAESPHLTILDISPRVLEHVKQARDRAGRGQPYVIQLPRDSADHWTDSAIQYWRDFGSSLGQAIDPIAPPATLEHVDARAVRIPAQTVLSLDSADLNIVSQRLSLPPAQKFDLIVATNILVYYGPFEQALALANIAEMLQPGGFLLTNDELPNVKSVPMRNLGHTSVTYSQTPQQGDAILWYQRQ
ncbi:MAG: hypothetical protein ABI995_02115, partial [Acidobacteriota bacterium]